MVKMFEVTPTQGLLTDIPIQKIIQLNETTNFQTNQHNYRHRHILYTQTKKEKKLTELLWGSRMEHDFDRWRWELAKIWGQTRTQRTLSSRGCKELFWSNGSSRHWNQNEKGVEEENVVICLFFIYVSLEVQRGSCWHKISGNGCWEMSFVSFAYTNKGQCLPTFVLVGWWSKSKLFFVFWW